jgi:hypothetical protein
MPITLAQPPQAVQELTQGKLQDIARSGNFRIEALSVSKPEQIRLASGHPVYNLGLNDILSSKPAAQLALFSWRFIVQGSGPEAVAAETLAKGPSDQAEFSSVNSGPFVAGTTEAFAAVTKDPAFAKGDWEMRLLRIPALYIFAVWAHEKSGEGDRLRPVKPAPSFLDPSKTYTWSEFLNTIKAPAEQRLASDDGLRG